MSYALAFSVTQGVDAQSFTLVDASTGSDANVVSRRVVITTNTGEYLVPTGTTTNYVPFPFSDGANITISVLPIDYAVSINLQYVDADGVALYSLSQNYCFTGNDEQFDYSLTQQLVANQSLLQDSNYVNNRFSLRMLIDAASKAVTVGNDINASEFLLDLALEYKDNQTKYF